MKILLIHSDFIEYEAKKQAIKDAEKAEKGPVRVKEALVVFSSVEKADEASPDEIIGNAVKEILDVQRQVKAASIVIYPFVHLSSTPSSPSAALHVLKGIESKLKEGNLDVKRAPFGWYKGFDLRCKGHPLAELSREITAKGGAAKPGKPAPPAPAAEEEIDVNRLLREIGKTKLDREKLKDNDHRIIGQQLDLFSFSDAAPGMAFWHPKGLIIWNELVRFWRELHREAGYQEISTPQIMDNRIWKISGHWEKYRDNIFLTQYEGRPFAVKPMNCPGGIMIYRNRARSYNDLPMRMAELGVVHRQELSGVLSGLFRVIKFTQDDAHIYCKEEQLEEEILAVISLAEKFYRKFGLEYHMELSTRPEKRIGSDEAWDRAEAALKAALDKRGIKYKVNEGDGAFYGPKIDFHIKDSLGRTWQCGTNQLDFAMPERFDLAYKDKDNTDKRPVMLHRTVYGSLERFIGILLEHTSGNLPLWLSPVQARVLSFTDRNVKAAGEAAKRFSEAGIRADADLGNNTVNYKVREAEMQKIPYIIVIGDKEEEAGTIAVRVRGEKKVRFGVKAGEFQKELLERIGKFE